MKIAFLKLLKTGDLKAPLKNVKKMNPISCAGSPLILCETLRSFWVKLGSQYELNNHLNRPLATFFLIRPKDQYGTIIIWDAGGSI